MSGVFTQTKFLEFVKCVKTDVGRRNGYKVAQKSASKCKFTRTCKTTLANLQCKTSSCLIVADYPYLRRYLGHKTPHVATRAVYEGDRASSEAK